MTVSYLKQDPFAVEGVFADYELLEWLIEGVNFGDHFCSDGSLRRKELLGNAARASSQW